MNKRVAVVMTVALTALLAAAGLWTVAAPGKVAAAQPLPTLGTAPEGQSLAGKEPAGGYGVQPGTAAGGVYQLATGSGADWSVRGTASGGAYRLEVVGAMRGTGTPCCCSYLPCTFK